VKGHCYAPDFAIKAMRNTVPIECNKKFENEG